MVSQANWLPLLDSDDGCARGLEAPPLFHHLLRQKGQRGWQEEVARNLETAWHWECLLRRLVGDHDQWNWLTSKHITAIFGSFTKAGKQPFEHMQRMTAANPERADDTTVLPDQTCPSSEFLGQMAT